MGWLRSLLGLEGRTTGRPPSGNGASSFHVWWDIEEPLRTVSATLEITEPPTVDRLYFFALQASFWSDRHEGGAHVGLQWNPRHPDAKAINWGGYDASGQILDGSSSPFPSTPNDVNTRDFAWQPGTPYRLTIGPGRDGAWPATVTGPDGATTTIRTLSCPGEALRRPVVWMEVFADCDHPPVAARWTDLSAVTMDGRDLAVTSGRLSYQSHAAGGCANTTTEIIDGSIVQRSASERTNAHDRTLSWAAT